MDDEQVNKNTQAIEWMGSYLHTQLGFRNKPNIEDEDGAVWEKYDKLYQEIHGNGKMGIKTKVVLMWRIHGFAWLMVGTVLGWTLKSILVK